MILDEHADAVGLALICNYDGLITEVLCDDFGIHDELAGVAHFVSIFDVASIQKGLALFLKVKERGVVFDWEINVSINGAPTAFCFAAAALGDRLVLLGSVASQEHNKIYDGLSHVINKQVNSLRGLTKASSPDLPQAPDSAALPDQVTVEMITDMLALNNRLVNAERQLARKNAELKRLSAVMSKDLYLAHRILHCTGEAVMIATFARQVIDVNSAYTAITGYSKYESVNKGLVLSEPGYDHPELLEAIWSSLETQGLWQGECRGRRKNGELFPKWLTISIVPDESGESGHYVVIFSDISRLKHAEEQWQRLAFYDDLTDLPNRTLFKDRLQQAIVLAQRDSEPLVLLFIDLDDFKLINDSLGHDAGDKLLCETASRLQACTREADTIYRLGGDEFTVIVHGCHDDLDAKHLCDKIISVLSLPFAIHEHSVHIGASIGIARYPIDGDNPDTLIKNADAAMYAAKALGRNASCFFSKSLGDKVTSYLNLKTQVAQGLQRREFTLFLQPEIELSSGRVVAIEALARWQHPIRGLVGPDEFIAVAENSGLIVELGEFVIAEALGIVRELRDLGWTEMRVGVNVSGRHIALPQFVGSIVNRLREQKLPGQALILEITESTVLENIDYAIDVLRELKRHGVETAIDDFGTGYSSLNYLRRLPVEFLKIDKSFVSDADMAAESKTIIRAISAMAKSLGLKTIAEGVERPAQETILREMGCEFGQGYLYAKPMPYHKLVEFIRSRSLVETL
ncbi:MAG: hypothetical protein BVN35_13355 [Proteobacteria bacterium ST_bin11]|nr:MAG: hypothetical protein BVN35_13355 [Proteobacteria bacterium ST_bin11]